MSAGDLIEQSLDGVPSASSPGEVMYLDNTAHPVAARLALAKATNSSFHAFGIDWDDASGNRNDRTMDTARPGCRCYAE